MGMGYEGSTGIPAGCLARNVSDNPGWKAVLATHQVWLPFKDPWSIDGISQDNNGIRIE